MNTQQEAHTALPWKGEAIATAQHPSDGPWYVFTLTGPDGALIAHVYPEDSIEGDANLRIIERSVNHHAELVEALRLFMGDPEVTSRCATELYDHAEIILATIDQEAASDQQ